MSSSEKRFHYITPEDTTTAEKNGITHNALYQRVHSYGWDIDRAITQPMKRDIPFHSEWIDTAKNNGIKLSVFRARVRNQGWDEETAATTPILSSVECGIRSGDKKNIFTEEQIKKMENLGLSRSTVRQRINSYGWSIEDAVNTPTLSLSERAKRARIGTIKRKKELAR